MRYPKEWLGFLCHWNGSVSELIEQIAGGWVYLRRIADDAYHFAHLADLSPLTPAARAFAKIAKAGK